MTIMIVPYFCLLLPTWFLPCLWDWRILFLDCVVQCVHNLRWPKPQPWTPRTGKRFRCFSNLNVRIRNRIRRALAIKLWLHSLIRMRISCSHFFLLNVQMLRYQPRLPCSIGSIPRALVSMMITIQCRRLSSHPGPVQYRLLRRGLTPSQIDSSSGCHESSAHSFEASFRGLGLPPKIVWNEAAFTDGGWVCFSEVACPHLCSVVTSSL